MNCKRIPITEAKRLAATYGQTQVIIVTWDKLNNRQHVVTYGKSITDCEQAAIGGNFVKKALGWPDELCHAEPARMRRKKMRSAGLQPTTAAAQNLPLDCVGIKPDSERGKLSGVR